jgi:hypothetical protein
LIFVTPAGAVQEVPLVRTWILLKPPAAGVSQVGAAPAPDDVSTCPDEPAFEPPIFMSPQNRLLVIELLPWVNSLLTLVEEVVALLPIMMLFDPLTRSPVPVAAAWYPMPIFPEPDVTPLSDE